MEVFYFWEILLLANLQLVLLLVSNSSTLWQVNPFFFLFSFIFIFIFFRFFYLYFIIIFKILYIYLSILFIGDVNSQILFTVDQTWTGNGYDFSLVMKTSSDFLDGSAGKITISSLGKLCGYISSRYQTYFVEDLYYDAKGDVIFISVKGMRSSKPFDR